MKTPRTPLVLVVDDDAAFRRDLCAALEDEGYATVGASNGRDALDWLSAGTIRPSVIVLDLHMDGMDGETFAVRLSKDRRCPAIPVLLISAHEGIDAIAARLNVHAALSKPFRPERLLTLVRSLCA